MIFFYTFFCFQHKKEDFCKPKIHSMPKTKKTSVLFIQRFILVLAIYQLIRIGFYFYNKSFFPDINSDVFIGGLVFDLSALGYMNILFAILHLIPGKFQQNSKYQKFLFYSFFIVNSIFISINFIDFEYFRFIGRRSSFSILTAEGMENEIGGLLVSYFIDFWQIPLFVLLTISSFYFLLKKINYTDVECSKKIYSYIGLVLTVGLLFTAGRGITKRPLSIVNSHNFGPIGTSALVLNTSFTVIKTLDTRETIKTVKYFSDNDAEKIYNPIQKFTHNEANKKNVVLLILESFGNENIKSGQTPFIDSLIQKSYFFENGFANGKTSMDAASSSISSLPALMNKSFISSIYAVNEIHSLTEVLKNNGYATSFFHGAFNGSQHFDKYAAHVKFDKYYGKNEYKGPDVFDGVWGIFDEEFLQFAASEIKTFKQPFFTTIFTISSHAPFTIPEKYKNKFPKGNSEIQESIAYADFAVKKFFDKAKHMPWYNNTIFVITADHTSAYGTESEQKNNVGKFRIPIMFYVPGDETMVGTNDKNFQQIDIFPSLIDYLQLNTEILSFGKSYKSKEDYVVSYLENIYNLEMGDYYLAFDGTKTLGLYNWKKDPNLKNNLIEKDVKRKHNMERFLKAYIQTFNNRLTQNKLRIEA